jgi:hypothetical protein
MAKLIVLITGAYLSIVLLAGCQEQREVPTSPVYEGRIGELLTDGRIGVRAIEFHKCFGGTMGVLGMGNTDDGLGMTYELVNLGASPLRFDKIEIVFWSQEITEANKFFVSADTVTLMTERGFTTYFGDPYVSGEKPKLPRAKNRPLVIPPLKAIKLEVSGYGTPLELVVRDDGEAKRNYKVILTICSGKATSHGPFTVNVAAREGKDRKLIFK